MNILAIGFAVGAALFWGLGQNLTKIGIQRMDWVSFVFTGRLFALVFTIPFGLLTTGFHFPDLHLVGIAASGGFMDLFVGVLLYIVALKKSTVHQAATLANTAPFWGVATAVLFLGEKLQIATFLAAILVVFGAYFLITRRSPVSIEHSFLKLLPALGAGLLWGVAETVPAKYCLTHGVNPITYQLIIVSTAIISWSILVLVRKRKDRLYYPWSGVKIALLTSFTGFFLGWIFWLYGLKFAPASMLAPIRGSLILFAFLFSILLLGEKPTKRSIIGVFLVFGGVFLVIILGQGG